MRGDMLPAEEAAAVAADWDDCEDGLLEEAARRAEGAPDRQDVAVLVADTGGRQLLRMEVPREAPGNSQRRLAHWFKKMFEGRKDSVTFDMYAMVDPTLDYDYLVKVIPKPVDQDDSDIMIIDNEEISGSVETASSTVENTSDHDQGKTDVVEKNECQSIWDQSLDNLRYHSMISNYAMENAIDNSTDDVEVELEVVVANTRTEEIYVEETEKIEEAEPRSFSPVSCTEKLDDDDDDDDDADNNVSCEALSSFENIIDTSSEAQVETSSHTKEEVSKEKPSKKPTRKSDILAIYPLPPLKGGISISRTDYRCLAENQFLNDIIIDFYLKYLMEEVLEPSDRRRTHIFSTHFYTRLAQVSSDDSLDSKSQVAQRRHAGVQRWTKNVNIFEKDFIIVPVNQYSHWFVAIICFPHLVDAVGLEDTDCFVNGDELQKPCILIFNSLFGDKDNEVATILRGYLYYEYLAKMHERKIFSINALRTVYPKVLKQTNATDCGVYVLQYVESFFKDPIKDFTLPLNSLSNWFASSEIKHKREAIAELIARLAVDFNDGKSVDLPSIVFPQREKSASLHDEQPDMLYDGPTASSTPSRKRTSWESPSNFFFRHNESALSEDEPVELFSTIKKTFLDEEEVCPLPSSCSQASPIEKNRQSSPFKRPKRQPKSRTEKMVEYARMVAERKEKTRAAEKYPREKKPRQYPPVDLDRNRRISKTPLSIERAKVSRPQLLRTGEPKVPTLTVRNASDPFYSLSFDALNRESSISPSISYSQFLKFHKKSVTEQSNTGTVSAKKFLY